MARRKRAEEDAVQARLLDERPCAGIPEAAQQADESGPAEASLSRFNDREDNLTDSARPSTSIQHVRNVERVPPTIAEEPEWVEVEEMARVDAGTHVTDELPAERPGKRARHV